MRIVLGVSLILFDSIQSSVITFFLTMCDTPKEEMKWALRDVSLYNELLPGRTQGTLRPRCENTGDCEGGCRHTALLI